MKLELRIRSCENMCLSKSLTKSLRKKALSSDQRVLKAAAEAIEAVQQEHEENEKDARGSRASGTTTTRPRRLRLESTLWSTVYSK